MWLHDLFGISDDSFETIHENLTLNGTTLTSKIKGSSYECGTLEVLSLKELRERVNQLGIKEGKITIEEVISDSKELHIEPANKGALFQAASQFNLLEMSSPLITPNDGIARYEMDRTQGPACAIAAGAGTVYRNYFASVNDKVGQSADNQIDCLSLLDKTLNNDENNIWEMSNGYALLKNDGLEILNDQLTKLNNVEIDGLRQLFQIGIQWNTQVTLSNEPDHLVSQAYCSALPISYSFSDMKLSEPFARLILEAAYEATFCAAIINAQHSGNKSLFLTKIGGGVFGNESGWIMDAIRRSIIIYRDYDLDVKITSYGASDSAVKEMLNA